VRKGQAYHKTRRSTPNQKAFICFLISELLILIVFLMLFHQSMPATKENTRQISGVVETVEYERAFSEYRLRIYVDGACYQFANLGVGAPTSNREIYENIREGETVTVQYVERLGVTGLERWVVDARSDRSIYRSIDEYNAQKRGVWILDIVLFSVFQAIWGLVLCVYWILFRKPHKRR